MVPNIRYGIIYVNNSTDSARELRHCGSIFSKYIIAIIWDTTWRSEQFIAVSFILAKAGAEQLRETAADAQTAKDAKYGFGPLIDFARAEPVMIAKHGRPVVVVMVVEEYERLKALTDNPALAVQKKIGR